MPVQMPSDEPTEYYGLVEEIIAAEPGVSRYSRSFLLFDCVKAEPFRRSSPHALADPSALALVRAMSTPRVWSERFGLGALAQGDWVVFTLDSKGDAPRAWELPAEQGYAAGPVRSVRSIRRLGEGLPSGGQGPDETLALQLTSASAWGRHGRSVVSVDTLAELLAGARDEDVEIIALDVGQASANLMKRGGVAIGFFDAGAPLWFNKGSIKLDFHPPAISQGFIFLSHWDFDHFDLGRRLYRDFDWFAPDQPVGPNAAKFQNELGPKLTFVSGIASRGGFLIASGTSTNPNDRNGSGFQLRYEKQGSAVLLTGDADYAFILANMMAGLKSVAVPHHGGAGTLPPPPLGPGALAVASYGQPNRYRHPSAATISGHVQLGWQVQATAAAPNLRRGNRPLFP
jgi:hypothetical protein